MCVEGDGGEIGIATIHLLATPTIPFTTMAEGERREEEEEEGEMGEEGEKGEEGQGFLRSPTKGEGTRGTRETERGGGGEEGGGEVEGDATGARTHQEGEEEVGREVSCDVPSSVRCPLIMVSSFIV